MCIGLGQSYKPMKSKFLFLTASVLLFAVASCDVERSEKYQSLLAERDSLYTEAVAAKGGFDNALNTIKRLRMPLSRCAPRKTLS